MRLVIRPDPETASRYIADYIVGALYILSHLVSSHH